MTLIEPCCTSKHIPTLLAKVGDGGTELWHGYGDLTVGDLLPTILAPYGGGTAVTLVAPRVQRYLCVTLRQLLQTNAIAHLSILTDARGDEGHDVLQTARDFPRRVTLASHPVADTVLLLPDTVWWGNAGSGREHVGIVSRNAALIAQIASQWEGVLRQYRIN